MVKHYCPRCLYKTINKGDILYHLNKITQCNVVDGGIDINVKENQHIIVDKIDPTEHLKLKLDNDTLKNEVEKLKMENIKLKHNKNNNTINGDNNTIDNSVNNNITVVLQLENTNSDRIIDMKGINDFKDLVTALHSFNENRNIYKPNLNKDKRIRALMKDGWNTFKSLEDIPKYLDKLKDIIDLSIRPNDDETMGMDNEDIIDQVNTGLYDIGRKYKMRN